MTKSILAVNAGSSSVKITFFTLEDPPRAVVDAQVSGITAPPPFLKYQRGPVKHKEQLKEKLNTPQDAFKYLLQRCFNDPELSEVASEEDLAYICHRVVHGGDYGEPVDINDETLHRLEEFEDLAPLYEPFKSSSDRIPADRKFLTAATISPHWRSSASARKNSQASLASPTSTPRSTSRSPHMSKHTPSTKRSPRRTGCASMASTGSATRSSCAPWPSIWGSRRHRPA